jgi:hypothetical protein
MGNNTATKRAQDAADAGDALEWLHGHIVECNLVECSLRMSAACGGRCKEGREVVRKVGLERREGFCTPFAESCCD